MNLTDALMIHLWLGALFLVSGSFAYAFAGLTYAILGVLLTVVNR